MIPTNVKKGTIIKYVKEVAEVVEVLNDEQLLVRIKSHGEEEIWYWNFCDITCEIVSENGIL